MGFSKSIWRKGSLLSDELDTPHFRDPRLLEFLLSDEALDIVQPIIGPNIGLWSSHFISKDPYTGAKLRGMKIRHSGMDGCLRSKRLLRYGGD